MVSTFDTLSTISHYSPSESPPRKHVVFLDLTRQEDVISTFLDVSIPPRTDHLVLTVTYDPTLDPRLPDDAHCPFPELDSAVTDVTIIFKTVFMAGRARSRPVVPGQLAVFEILLGFVGYNTAPGRRFTLVGMQDVDWRWVGEPARPNHVVNSAMIAIQDSYRKPEAWGCTDIRSVINGLVFTSMSQYRSDGEDEEYRENTVRPSPWRGERGHWI
ncbi:uncharacterized protein LOC62_05G007092 [Vanrija pseudolonga]|uniref:Uncharacterized protein n=1 Tax=Vanrija pseudolonga TaxID=143232 RepID=A0AAF0YGS4_9TREE|nr:hypothetical protein LOC62_05G007092 [Vanrija pseudolonga]